MAPTHILNETVSTVYSSADLIYLHDLRDHGVPSLQSGLFIRPTDKTCVGTSQTLQDASVQKNLSQVSENEEYDEENLIALAMQSDLSTKCGEDRAVVQENQSCQGRPVSEPKPNHKIDAWQRDQILIRMSLQSENDSAANAPEDVGQDGNEHSCFIPHSIDRPEASTAHQYPENTRSKRRLVSVSVTQTYRETVSVEEEFDSSTGVNSFHNTTWFQA